MKGPSTQMMTKVGCGVKKTKLLLNQKAKGEE